MFNFFSRLHKENSGLTSIELVVVFGIFAALASSVLFNYRQFSSNIGLQNLAQDIALQVRQAQNRSVSGSTPNLFPGQNPPPAEWAPSYGLYFSKNEGENNRFISFYDYNTSAVSNPSPENFGDRQLGDTSCNFSDPSSECLDVIEMTGGEFVESICINEMTTGTCGAVTDVHIVFSRPLNRAYFFSELANENTFISDVSLYLQSPNDSRVRITVTATGQIVIDKLANE